MLSSNLSNEQSVEIYFTLNSHDYSVSHHDRIWIFTITGRFLACLLRAMFDKSTGHGNNVMVVQFVFLEHIIFQESYTEMDIKIANHLLFQKTNRQQFSMVCTLIDHRNDIKMFKTLQWNHSQFHLGFEHWNHFFGQQQDGLWKIVVDLLELYVFFFATVLTVFDSTITLPQITIWVRWHMSNRDDRTGASSCILKTL